MTYPLKFRQKVFEVKKKYSLTYQETSERFDISIRTLFRWEQRLEPKKTRNKPAKIDMDALAQHVEDYPDAYQWERAQHFNVAKTTINYALKRLKLSRKKNIKSSESR